MAIPPHPARPDPPPAPSRAGHRSTGARALWMVAGMALIASAAFSIGEVRGARHHPTNGSAPAASSSPLSGLSISGLQNLESQVSQAAALAQGATGSDASAPDLSQLEQQLGISSSASPQDQAQQLQSELDAINACLSGSTATSSAC